MTKSRVVLSIPISPQAAIGATTIRDENVIGLANRLIKLASISLVCSSLYVCSSNAIVVPNPVDADKPIHIRSPVHLHKSKPVDKPIVVHKEVHIKARTRKRNDIYVKAGVGAMFYRKFKAIEYGYKNKAPRTTPVYNLGIGYRINDSVRADLNFQYAEVRYKAYDLRQIIKTKAAFVNGYYDINSHKNIIPYLTAGLGIGSNNAGYLTTHGEAECRGRDKTNFIYNIGGGGMFKANNNFALDLSYRYMDLGRTKTDNGKFTFYEGGKQNMRAHQVMGSLIYTF